MPILLTRILPVVIIGVLVYAVYVITKMYVDEKDLDKTRLTSLVIILATIVIILFGYLMSASD